MLTITLYPSQPHAGAGLVEAAENTFVNKNCKMVFET